MGDLFGAPVTPPDVALRDKGTGEQHRLSGEERMKGKGAEGGGGRLCTITSGLFAASPTPPSPISSSFFLLLLSSFLQSAQLSPSCPLPCSHGTSLPLQAISPQPAPNPPLLKPGLNIVRGALERKAIFDTPSRKCPCDSFHCQSLGDRFASRCLSRLQ